MVVIKPNINKIKYPKISVVSLTIQYKILNEFKNFNIELTYNSRLKKPKNSGGVG